jgi:hypothetical protein
MSQRIHSARDHDATAHVGKPPLLWKHGGSKTRRKVVEFAGASVD